MAPPLIELIKARRMRAMKDNDKFNYDVFTVFIGDLENDQKRGNTVDDVYVVKALKKAHANAGENYKYSNDERFLKEQEIYEEFLPKQMSKDELSNCIDIIIIHDQYEQYEQGREVNIGTVMKALKKDYDGQFDGKLASKIVKAKLWKSEGLY